MARVKDPILFSSFFKIDPDVLANAGLIDPFLNVDTQLFIDPVLLGKSANEVIRTKAAAAFHKHFENFVRLLVISQAEGDAAWRAAQRLLNLREPSENGLGYGGSGRSGSSRPDEVRDAMVRTAKEIVDLGSRDPDMIALMGFFEEKVGPDTISDFTTRVIVRQLAEITETFCRTHNVPVKKVSAEQDLSLPCYRNACGTEQALVLVPCDIVRELPVANDWSDIEAAASANSRIRDRVNAFLAGIARPTVADRKAALRKAATESAELFDSFLMSVKDFVAHYDRNKDILGYYGLKALLSRDKEAFKSEKKHDLSAGISSVIEGIASVVRQTTRCVNTLATCVIRRLLGVGN